MGRNFFTENCDLRHHFQNLDIREALWLREHLKEGDFLGGLFATYEAKLSEVGALCAEKIAPRAMQVDAEGARCENGRVILSDAIAENLNDLKNAGVCGVCLPARYGGLNFPVSVYAMMIEMVSRADASLQTFFGLQSIAETINDFGSQEQKWEILPGFAKGDFTGAMVLTEPDAGSDLQALGTTATLGEDGVWRLNGVKHFITNGDADVMLVLARSEEGTRDARGLSLFLVRRCPEVTVLRLEQKLGIHGSPTCVLRLHDAPAELVGKRKFGLIRYVMALMNSARLSIGAQAVGLMEAVREASWEYCRQRRQFGRPIAEAAPVWELLSRMDALTAACRALLYETCKWTDLRNAWNQAAQENPDDRTAPARAREFGVLADLLTPILKYLASESASACAHDGIQCLGGRGYMHEYGMERLYRDARIMSIYEGTSQMQVVAATSGILKGHLELLFGILFKAPFADAAKPLLDKVRTAHDMLLEAQARIPQESLELLSRRLVRGNALVLAALILLRDAGDSPERLRTAARFCWEFLPEAEAQARFLSSEATSVDHIAFKPQT